jgi:hypothetical protein
MILDILESLLRGLHILLAYLIQSIMNQYKIPIQEPSYIQSTLKNLFPLLKVDPIQLQ